MLTASSLRFAHSSPHLALADAEVLSRRLVVHQQAFVLHWTGPFLLALAENVVDVGLHCA